LGTASPIKVSLTSGEPVAQTAETTVDSNGVIPIEFRHGGLVPGSALHEEEIELPSTSLPNIEILSVSLKPAGTDSPPKALSWHGGQVATFDHAGQPFRFFVDNPHDSIQAHHYAGEFYEIEELELIGAHVGEGARFLDVGANIGNHAVYFEKVLKAARVTAIELQPRVISVLRLNAALNELKVTDLSKLGVGFGTADLFADIRVPQAFNVAGAHFDVDPAGSFRISRGDDVLEGEEFDFVKIDVEGAECDVIEGLSETIARNGPLLFVEVWNENRERFDLLMEKLGYDPVAEFRRYGIATNLLMGSRRNG
jgi:FkbM family methyltransferase